MSSLWTGIRGLFQSPKSKNDFQQMNIIELVTWIQPEWNRYHTVGVSHFTNSEITNLRTALEVYKDKGGDIEYFQSGSGAPNNCVLC